MRFRATVSRCHGVHAEAAILVAVLLADGCLAAIATGVRWHSPALAAGWRHDDVAGGGQPEAAVRRPRVAALAAWRIVRRTAARTVGEA
jgi:hypothetical protein